MALDVKRLIQMEMVMCLVITQPCPNLTAHDRSNVLHGDWMDSSTEVVSLDFQAFQPLTTVQAIAKILNLALS